MAPYTSSTPISELVADYASIIKGKTILTTGVTPKGLGATFVEATAAASPELLILAGRTASKLQELSETISATHPGVKTRHLIVDLSSMDSVRKAAEEVNGWGDVSEIDVVVNNAGVMAIPYATTSDGFEMQFAADHLGHFLLTNLIMDKILASKSPRVVNVSSNGHSFSPVRHYDPHFSASPPQRSSSSMLANSRQKGETYERWTAYGQAKTANMLFSLSLAQKLGSRGLQAYSVHPGLIMSTNLGSHLDFASPDKDLKSFLETHRSRGNSEGWEFFEAVPVEVGAATHAFAAFDPNIKASNGAYLLESRVSDPYVDTVKAWARDTVEADKAWKLSEELVKQKFSY
ncbi:Hypothetical protein NCS54_00024300 [Fusarium falciforme]|uniref:Hypothetical protein n=1 Tax=Fusarium falciforme TaxID=195108 RepID=UPI0023016BE3|nr:Hypothetical protein NCS54_00024300 [Fusarium falciforme]WAO83063.1 Hypothetical protein NCS54_00024300 [Fusarium falciforme]